MRLSGRRLQELELEVDMRQNVRSVAVVLGLLASAVWTVGGAEAAVAKEGAPERVLRYELRALGAYAGEAVLQIGALTQVGKRTLRPIRVEAHTAGLAASFLNATTTATTWVNASFLPVRARWDQVINQGKRVMKASFERKRITGSDERDGKPAKDFDLAAGERGLDLVSIFPWLMQARLAPGTKYGMPVFDGQRIYQVDVTVGVARELQLPVGFRQAIPLKIRVTRGSYKRDMELFISAEKDRAPLKMVFKYGLIGTVEATLVSEKKG